MSEASSLSIDWKGQDWILSSERALYWPAQKAWLVADLHLGKTEHFRKSGIPLPQGSCKKTLDRLNRLLASPNSQKLIIMGDLFHSTYNRVWEEFVHWRNQHPSVEMHLVKGNHDILDEYQYKKAGLLCHQNKLTISGIHLLHDPSDASKGEASIGGHLHPGLRLKGKGKQSIRLACFWFQQEICILPAAGYFTGLSEIQQNKEDRVFVCTEESVIEV